VRGAEPQQKAGSLKVAPFGGATGQDEERARRVWRTTGASTRGAKRDQGRTCRQGAEQRAKRLANGWPARLGGSRDRDASRGGPLPDPAGRGEGLAVLTSVDHRAARSVAEADHRRRRARSRGVCEPCPARVGECGPPFTGEGTHPRRRRAVSGEYSRRGATEKTAPSSTGSWARTRAIGRGRVAFFAQTAARELEAPRCRARRRAPLRCAA